MTRDELAAIVRSRMPEALYSRPGGVLLGGPSTLRPGPVYVMGLNPAGDPEKITEPLIETLAAPDGHSGYTHECWHLACPGGAACVHLGADGRTLPSALVRHQRNMIALAGALLGTPATLFSANAIFARSTSKRMLEAQTGLGLRDWWNACWPVHQAFLAIVRPRLVVTLGYGETSSAFGLLRAAAGYPPFRRFGDEGRRGGWAFDGTLALGDADHLQATIVGVPHPSYHAPGPVLSEMLTELVEGRLVS